MDSRPLSSLLKLVREVSSGLAGLTELYKIVNAS